VTDYYYIAVDWLLLINYFWLVRCRCCTSYRYTIKLRIAVRWLKLSHKRQFKCCSFRTQTRNFCVSCTDYHSCQYTYQPK